MNGREAIKMTAWQNDYVVKNKFSRPGFPLQKVLGVVVHWTATPGATDENEKAFFDGADGGGSRYASAHIFVDQDSARCIIPLNEVAYHANEKASKVAKLKATASYYTGGNANLNTIGVEMCVEKDGTLHPETVERTACVVAELCNMFGLDPGADVYRHYDITGKNCPAPWVTNAGLFNEFKAKARTKMMPEYKPTNIVRYIYSGGYAGPALQNIHDYLFRVGHGFDVKRGADGSIIFLIGPFDTGMANYAECTASIAKFDGHAKLLTREEAAEWRAN
jgi:hypothetical protein